MRQRIALLVILLAIVAIAWVTRYKYISFRDADSTYPVRINRYTDHTQMFDGDWRELK